jgi:hypothetical protein
MESLVIFGAAILAAAGAVAVKAFSNAGKLKTLRRKMSESGAAADPEALEKQIEEIVNKP